MRSETPTVGSDGGFIIPCEVTPAAMKALQEGFVYQHMRHSCGYEGNIFAKRESGEWDRRTHCPQCGDVLTFIPFSEYIKRLLLGDAHAD